MIYNSCIRNNNNIVLKELRVKQRNYSWGHFLHAMHLPILPSRLPVMYNIHDIFHLEVHHRPTIVSWAEGGFMAEGQKIHLHRTINALCCSD